jgi:hypothetical protein
MASFRPETFTKIWHLGARFAPCRTRETLGIPTKPRKRRRFPNNAEAYTRDRTGWLGREDSNLRMAESKSAALPLGYAPLRPASPPAHRAVRRRRNIIGGFLPINDCGGKCQFGRSIRQIDSTCLCTASAHCRVLVVFTIISFEGAVSANSLTAARPNQTVEGTCSTRL